MNEEDPNQYDNVNRPRHYLQHPSGIEPIVLCRHMTFNLGQVIKYVFRDHKGATIEDLRKAAWYLDDEIKLRESQEKGKESS